ncbi:MAG: hypothetical protein JXA44_13655 [Methanospirillaceae archaeon]|nr:hypothetical protein [Methanospirillaceae archaeon]
MNRKNGITVCIIAIIAVVLIYAQSGISFGDPVYQDMDQYFLLNGQVQTGGNNICTDVVFDFRAFDTLGEATVLFTAVMGVIVIFRRLMKGEEYEAE